METKIVGKFPLSLCPNHAVIKFLEQPLYKNDEHMQMGCLKEITLILPIEIQEKGV